MEAQAAGMAAMWAGAGQNTEMIKYFMAVDTGLFRDLASKTAQAVQGMQPKINIWNTGAGGEALLSPYTRCHSTFMLLHMGVRPTTRSASCVYSWQWCSA